MKKLIAILTISSLLCSCVVVRNVDRNYKARAEYKAMKYAKKYHTITKNN